MTLDEFLEIRGYGTRIVIDHSQCFEARLETSIDNKERIGYGSTIQSALDDLKRCSLPQRWVTLL